MKKSDIPASDILKNYLLHGQQQDNKKPLSLKAGKVTMIYEAGSLRYISCGRTELIRMIYSAVRDKEWITLNPVISNEVIKKAKNSFIISYHSSFKSGNAEFAADILIEGKPDSSIIFSFEGEALTPFEKNRAGICVLHPVTGYAGIPCEIIHTNGESESSVFPLNIAPYQPFTEIILMKWTIAGCTAALRFEGDIFETEDQRNWADASYKTYSTPLRLPFPVTLSKGEKASQKVELTLSGNFPANYKTQKYETIWLAEEYETCLPSIGIERSTRPEFLSENEIRILSKLRFDHYRIDLFLFDPSWRDTAEISVAEAKQLDYKIEFALFFDDQASTEAISFIEWLKTKDISPAVILILHKSENTTPDCVADSVARRFKNAFPDVKIATGTNANFAQLNRYRPASFLSDLLCYSVHPQEHASDLKTLTENISSLKDTVASAKAFSSGKGIWVSPVNIQRRFNANIEYYEKPYTGQEAPPQVDPRLMSLYGACWTTGSMKYLTESEPQGITFFETVGERGIFQGDRYSRWPDIFPADKGMIFPVYFIFYFLLKHKSWRVIKTKSSDPLKTECLGFSDGNRSNFIVVNLTTGIQKVKIQSTPGLFNLRQLNENNCNDAVFDHDWLERTEAERTKLTKPLNLAPFSINFFEKIL